MNGFAFCESDSVNASQQRRYRHMPDISSKCFMSRRCRPILDIGTFGLDSMSRKSLHQTFLYLALVFLNSLCYYNSLKSGFAFDDISAIINNMDLRPQTPIFQLLQNDFWGQPMIKEHSHKSYRPLCVFTFRLNYLFHQLQPFGYHLTNVVLHILVTIMYFRFCLLITPLPVSFLAAVLFSVNPIHTEAVASVVGRAETLCSMFFFASLFFYSISTNRSTVTNWTQFSLAIIAAALATLSKEQGITVIALCCIYEIVLNQKLHQRGTKFPSLKDKRILKISCPKWIKEMAIRIAILVMSAIFMMGIRLKVMHSQLPVFTRFDNPAAYSESPTRQLTHNYLLALNAWLLINPMDLCCDWTMGTIPLVKSVMDMRNIATIAFYVTLLGLIWKAFIARHRPTSTVIIVALSLVIFPFLPASNLFFPVGFVLAERILYIPSFGFCLLVSYAIFSLRNFVLNKVYLNRTKNCAIVVLTCTILISHSVRTVLRNEDWESEYKIFTSGLKITKQNAKLYNNVGHVFEAEGNYSQALSYFFRAIEVQPDDLGTYVNVGRTFVNLKQFQSAEKYFVDAKNLLMKQLKERRNGKYARIAPSYLKIFLNLANLVSQNNSRLEEAEQLYREVISLRLDYVEAYINLGEILLRRNKTSEAEKIYKKALQYDNNNADVHYNLGVVSIHTNKLHQAINYFERTLEINPNHRQALLNFAIVIQDADRKDLFQHGQQGLLRLLSLGEKSERVYFNLGLIEMGNKNTKEAEKWFRQAIEVRSDFRSALFNLALLLSENNSPLEALIYLKRLVKLNPDHIKGLVLMGDILINNAKDLNGAEQCYERILQLDSKNIQAKHNLCVVYVEQGYLDKAEQCLVEAAQMAPHEDYINRHLKIVRLRIVKLKKIKSTSKESFSTK